MTHTDSTDPRSPSEPRWKLIYASVLISLVLVITLLYLFSKAWTPG